MAGQLKKKKRNAKDHRFRTDKMVRAIGFPAEQRATLKYAQTGSFTVSTASIFSFPFATNGLFDPYLSTGGHQPYQFDQWMELYTFATVASSRLKLTVLDAASTGGYAHGTDRTIACGVYANGFAVSDFTSWPTIVESGRGTHSFTNAGKTELHAEYDMRKWYTTLPDPGSQTNTVSANCSLVNRFVVWFQTLDVLTPLANPIAFVVEIEYDVIFSEPQAVGPS